MARNVGFISRRTALAAAVVAGASLLGGFSAAAQQVAANSPSQATSLVEKCDVIQNVFHNSAKLVKETSIKPFTTGYQGQLEAFFGKNCEGTVPLPTARNDIQLFNTIAGILQNGGGISLTP